MLINIVPYGEGHLLIQWPKQIDEQIIQEVHLLRDAIQKELTAYIIETTPSYQELLVNYQEINFDSLSVKINKLYENLSHNDLIPTTWKLPIYFEKHKDHLAISQYSGLDFQEYINTFLSTSYTIAMKGFLPGFIYLSGLAAALHIPRKIKPDKNIPAGSLAIGGAQAGIYPQNSPGGWHVLGLTPIPLLDYNEPNFSAFNPGDKILFYSIIKDEFDQLKAQEWTIGSISQKYRTHG